MTLNQELFHNMQLFALESQEVDLADRARKAGL